MSADSSPEKPNFGETQWITSEDINIEHLLDVFTTIDGNSDDVWKACANFMTHLHWYKKPSRFSEAKVEGLPDDHYLKLECLLELSDLIFSIGNFPECKRLLTHALKLGREQGDIRMVARASKDLSNTNRLMGFPKEGIPQVKEALEIYERLGDTAGWADCSIRLALSVVRRQTVRRRRRSHAPRDRPPPPGERRTISGLPMLSESRRNISIQGRDREGDSTFRTSPRNCDPVRLARPPVLGSPLRWRPCFAKKAGPTTHRLRLNVPSCTRPLCTLPGYCDG
jgi:hypothetical protein